MITGFNAASILQAVFGVSMPIYLPFGKDEAYKSDQYQSITLVPEDEAEYTSSFGTPVMGTFEFGEGEYNTYDIHGKVIKMKLEAWLMPFTSLVEFSRASVLTQTKTLGGTGTVKELFGLDDWKIVIKGVALNDRLQSNQLSAQQQIEKLTTWSKVCDSIKVTGAVFGNKGIHNIVIEKFSILPTTKYNVIPFQLDCISDEAIELVIP